MPNLVHVLEYISTAGFCLLALITVWRWIRHRGASSAYLALAVGLLGLVSLVSELSKALLPTSIAMVVGIFSLVGFMGAGYALLLFRDSLIPLRRRTKVGVGVVTAAVTAVACVIFLSAGVSSAIQFGVVIVIFAIWIGSVGEPVVRLWLVSRHLPVVQRSRVRALSLGYGGIAVVLLVAILAAPLAKNPGYQIGVQLVAIATIPLLYVAFAPPRWLRRYWREGEEFAVADGIRELLLYSPDRATLAEKSLEWATRLVGAEGGLVVDAGGEVLHSGGLDDAGRDRLLAEVRAGRQRLVDLGGGRSAMVGPWNLEAGYGGIAVVSGPFSPLFGSDELARLNQYAVATAAALDRVRLVESLRRSETDLRQLNLDLERRVSQRTEQLEASNKELEAFSYTVSHDLRAPLRAIDGFSRILVEENQGRLSEGGQRHLELICNNAEDMGRLIDGLLTFSRLTRQEMKRQVLNPGDIATQVADRVMAGIDGRHIDIAVREMPQCLSDLVLLQQVYANLIGNAVKFTRDRDPAKIEVGTMLDGEGETIFYVKDNGVGFDMKYADKLFGVFQRLHRSEEFEGSGAGLAIVQRIVHRHGGRIWADSSPEKGATFYFTLGSPEEVAMAGSSTGGV